MSHKIKVDLKLPLDPGTWLDSLDGAIPYFQQNLKLNSNKINLMYDADSW